MMDEITVLPIYQVKVMKRMFPVVSQEIINSETIYTVQEVIGSNKLEKYQEGHLIHESTFSFLFVI